jgi:voltage-gated potassium channel
MMSTQTTQGGCAAEEPGLFQVLILFLSVFVLGAIMAQTFFALPPQVNLLLNRIDTLICAVFIGDFCYRLYRAGDKAVFLRWGWIDLVSSIPAVEVLRWGRVVRVVRLLRVLRAFRSVKVFLACLYRRRARAAFTTAGASAFLVAIFSSIAILTFENVPGANISTAGDSLWWAFYTMANIDYAGHYPVSPEGKAVRLLLVITGMVLFGVFTGYAASAFMEDTEKKETTEIEGLKREVEGLRADMGRRG